MSRRGSCVSSLGEEGAKEGVDEHLLTGMVPLHKVGEQGGDESTDSECGGEDLFV